MRTVFVCLIVSVFLTGCEEPCIDDAGRFNWECAGARFKAEGYCCDSLAVIDANRDGYNDVLIGGTGGGYLFYGPVAGTRHLSNADVKFGTTGAASAVSAGDVNGDGHDDIMIGTERNVKLILGPFDAPLPAADASIFGAVGPEYRRFKPVGVGDVNGDGYDDVLIGVSIRVVEDCEGWWTGECDHYEGETHLFYGPLDGTLWLSDADASISSTDGGHQVAAAGDFNGDGFDDFLVGVSRRNNGSGAAYVFFGPVSGQLSFDDAGAVFQGISGRRIGSSMKSAGDFNSDGCGDVLIGSLYAGRACLVNGPVAGNYDLFGARTQFINGSSSFEIGLDFDMVGDVDGDGISDFLLGDRYHDSGRTLRGNAYLVRGPASGSINLSRADVEFVGRKRDSQTGRAVAGAGDMNGDGLDDFLIASPGRQEVHLIYGW
jgi:hypothetical protein